MGMRFVVAGLLAAFLLGVIPACGSAESEKKQFQSDFEQAVKAAETGKEQVKASTKRR